MQKCATIVFILIASQSFQSFAEEPANTVLDASINANIEKCRANTKTVSEHVINNSDHGSHTKWNENNSDDSIFTSVVETVYEEDSAISSITLAPVTNGNCEAVITQIFHSKDSCLTTMKTNYPEAKDLGTLAERVRLISSGTIHVYLVPTNPGCMFMKKEYVTFSTE